MAPARPAPETPVAAPPRAEVPTAADGEADTVVGAEAKAEAKAEAEATAEAEASRRRGGRGPQVCPGTYRDPQGRTWSSGPGRRPVWVSQILTAGGDLEAYRVPPCA